MGGRDRLMLVLHGKGNAEQDVCWSEIIDVRLVGVWEQKELYKYREDEKDAVYLKNRTGAAAPWSQRHWEVQAAGDLSGAPAGHSSQHWLQKEIWATRVLI